MILSIIKAATDPNLFRPYLGSDASTWQAWFIALRLLFGLPVRDGDAGFIQSCTGSKKHRPSGYRRGLFLCGRRSGKSKIAGLTAAYLAAMSGLESQLSAGERGLVVTISPTKEQSEIVRQYIRGAFESPLLKAEIVDDNRGVFTLGNGVEIRTLAGDFRTSRGFTLLGAVVDEICFFRHSEESQTTAKELIRALRPALATINGSKLLAIGSKYSMDGWAYEQWKKNFGNDSGTLVWDATSRAMNPSLSEAEIADAVADDPESARSEFFNEWRDDVAAFLPRSLIESLVIPGRRELLPRQGTVYHAFVDMSGGRMDDAACAICHKAENGKTALDKLLRFKPPFDPYTVIANIAGELKRFGIRRVVDDRYSAEFTTAAFRRCGVAYHNSEKTKAELYLESLPLLCGSNVELLDDPKLIDQFAALERKTRSGGKDIVDHPRGGHDDLANAVSGAIYSAGKRRVMVGDFGSGGAGNELSANRARLAGMALGQHSGQHF